MIYILYSNDYEVYLGGNYLSEKEVVVDTTNHILEACSTIGIPMTYFCDVACLWRYRELGYTEFPDMVDCQMRDAVSRGNDVQAHIHPHWQNTVILRSGASTRYQFNRNKFLLGHCFDNDVQAFKRTMLAIFLKAKTYLTDLLLPISPDYRCVAFRAGGSGIQPKTELIIAALMDAGFCIDSSVVPELFWMGSVNRIDFKKMPKQANYRFVADKTADGFGDDGIFEIPIVAMSGLRAPMTLSFLKKIMQLTTYSILGKSKKVRPRGYSVQYADNAKMLKPRLHQKIMNELQRVKIGWHMLELSDDDNLMFLLTRKYLQRFIDGQQDIYFSFCMHSKSITPKMLQALGRYHEKLLKYYGSDLKAITYQYAARQIEKQVSTY